MTSSKNQQQQEQQAAGTLANPSLNDYYSATQLRADRWSGLKGITARLAQAQRRRGATVQLADKARRTLAALEPIEMYWAFPGPALFDHLRRLLEAEGYDALARTTARIVRALMSGSHRRRAIGLDYAQGTEAERDDEEELPESREGRAHSKPYFEVLIVDSLAPHQEHALRAGLRDVRRPEDRFVYELVFVPSFEDALIAVLVNHNIQTVVVRYGFPFESKHKLRILQSYLNRVRGDEELEGIPPEDYGVELTRLIGRVRPELDVFLVTDQSVEEIAGKDLGRCRRVFYNQEDYIELHLNILQSVNERYETPFFTALREYSRQPTGVFHAMPISRGKSVFKSHWIQDMGDFYGANIFLAETSATSGGLDSLLDPQGTIKRAQELAGRAFGARHTFFATNGTSTCNKIVVQALVRPGDIVLVDRDCHKSHHYGLVLAGAQVVYLDSYPLSEYSMYGAVPLREIKHRLLELRAAGKLDRVRLLLLT